MHDSAEPEGFRALSDLQLQLVQLRAEARAARLEALAARLERLLRCHSSEVSSRALVNPSSTVEVLDSPGIDTRPGVPVEPIARFERPDSESTSEAPGHLDFLAPWPTSWEVFLGGNAGSPDGSSCLESQSKSRNPMPATSIPMDAEAAGNSSKSVDAASSSSAELLRTGELLRTDDVGPIDRAAARRGDTVGEGEVEALDCEVSENRDRVEIKEFHRFISRFAKPEVAQSFRRAASSLELTASTSIDDTGGAIALKRRRPAALGVSLVLHAIVLMVFAGITITSQLPKDAIVLSATRVEETSEIQVAEFETAESPEDTAVASEVDSAMDASPVDVLNDASAVVLPISSVPATLAGPVSGVSSVVGDGGLADTLPQDVSTQFFGVNGGGNTFVYLVDSSRSMDDVSRDGFEVARNELLRAVDQLTERQKFFVIFFGEETWTMPLGEQTDGMQRLVAATRENKESLRRWALSLQMQPGAWPREALQVAFKLRPDCIFLLTDGAMSENVIPLIKRENIVDTLFDGPKPRSIIHTIGFHNAEGEARLREIAKLSGGAYRFVPPTSTVRR